MSTEDDMAKWRAHLRKMSGSCLLLHAYGGNPRAVAWTVEDLELSIDPDAAKKAIYDEIDRRIPPL